ncbi:hypothetical protein [Streptomyces sp. NPDC002690]
MRPTPPCRLDGTCVCESRLHGTAGERTVLPAGAAVLGLRDARRPLVALGPRPLADPVAVKALLALVVTEVLPVVALGRAAHLLPDEHPLRLGVLPGPEELLVRTILRRADVIVWVDGPAAASDCARAFTGLVSAYARAEGADRTDWWAEITSYRLHHRQRRRTREPAPHRVLLTDMPRKAAVSPTAAPCRPAGTAARTPHGLRAPLHDGFPPTTDSSFDGHQNANRE